MNVRTIVTLLVLTAVVPTAGGCYLRGPRPRDVVVSVDRSLRDADGRLRSVQVDLIAVGREELDEWRRVDVDEYWRPGGSSLHGNADKVVLTFSFQEDVDVKTLPAYHPAWQRWLAGGPTHLVMIARVAGMNVGRGKVGDDDPRRVAVPLDPEAWDRPDVPIKVRVSCAGLDVRTPYDENFDPTTGQPKGESR